MKIPFITITKRIKMKNIIIALTFLPALYAYDAYGGTLTNVLKIHYSMQSNEGIFNAATHTLTSSTRGDLINAVVWTTRCPNSFDVPLERKKTVLSGFENIVDKNYTTIPTGWINEWQCGSTHACSVVFKGVGGYRVEGGATIMGTGVNISIVGGLADAGDRTVEMIKPPCAQGGICEML